VSEEQQKLDVNWVQAAAGALAAMSSAVLLSTVGVAGTIIGAAAGSVIATVGSTIYSYYLRLSRERVAAAARLRSQHFRSRRTTSGPGLAPAVAPDLEHTATLSADETVVTAAAEATPSAEQARATEPVHWREVLVGLPWKRIGVVSVALFVAAMVVIVAFELTTGRALSTYTGGTADHGARTSIPGLGRAAASLPAPTHQQPTSAPTHQPSSAATTAPGSTPTQAPQEATTPTPASTPTPTQDGTPTPTPTPTPTQTTLPQQATTPTEVTTPGSDATAPSPDPAG
jgi:hypothetical protein